jgi:DNA-binding GntR family transcriptional regulator
MHGHREGGGDVNEARETLNRTNRGGTARGVLSRQVFAVLSERIVSLTLKPFEQLSEVNVAAELGVSRTPVREAFVRLSELGLVDIYPQRGTLVAPLRLPDLEKSQFLREALEIALLRRAMQRGQTDHLVARLRAEIAVQRAFVEIGEMQRFYASDEAFHALIAEFAGMDAVLSEIDRAKIHINRARVLMISGIEDVKVVLMQHAAIVDAIEAGDVAAAVAAMQVHLRRVLGFLDDARARFPEFFETEGAPRPKRRSRG